MARGNKKEEKKTVISDIKVLRASEYHETVFLDLQVNGVTIYGCTYNVGKDGKPDWIGFPSRKGKDGKYYKHAYVDLDEAMVNLIDEQLDELL